MSLREQSSDLSQPDLHKSRSWAVAERTRFYLTHIHCSLYQSESIFSDAVIRKEAKEDMATDETLRKKG